MMQEGEVMGEQPSPSPSTNATPNRSSTPSLPISPQRYRANSGDGGEEEEEGLYEMEPIEGHDQVQYVDEEGNVVEGYYEGEGEGDEGEGEGEGEGGTMETEDGKHWVMRGHMLPRGYSTEEEGTEDEKVMGVSEFLNLQRELARMREMLYDDKKRGDRAARRESRREGREKKKSKKGRKHKKRHRSLGSQATAEMGLGLGQPIPQLMSTNGNTDLVGNGNNEYNNKDDADNVDNDSFEGQSDDDNWRMQRLNVSPPKSPLDGTGSETSPRPPDVAPGDGNEDIRILNGTGEGEGEGFVEEIDLNSGEEDGGIGDPTHNETRLKPGEGIPSGLQFDLDTSSTESEMTDQEFIYMRDPGDAERRLRHRKKRKKRKKRRQRQAEALGLLGNSAASHENSPGMGYTSPFALHNTGDDESKYYAGGETFDGFTPTFYGSFQKDLNEDAMKFAEQIHRRPGGKKNREWPDSVKTKIWQNWEHMQLNYQHNFVWLYLLWLGALTACIGIGMDYCIIYLQQAHYYVTDHSSKDFWIQYFIWVAYLLFWAGCAMLVTRLAPTAQGSGIPEMKAILSGVNLKRYMTLPMLFVKTMSICCSVGSGLILGKVGPFIHVCATLANQLARFPLFHRIRENPILLQQMMAVGCAMGVASHFGAPIGGVLFSIEVTSTYYPLSTYASAFNCAIVGALIFRYFWFDSSFCPTKFRMDSWAYSELPWFALLGIAMGILGALFVHFFAAVVARRRWFATITTGVKSERLKPLMAFINHPYVYGMMVALMTAVLTFPGIARWISLPGLFALQDLFSDGDLDAGTMNAQDWATDGHLLWHLFLFIVSRFFFLGISISMPLSSGLFVPLLVTGAAMGRWWGELLRILLPQLKIQSGVEFIDLALGWHIAPGGYALVGAAAYTAAVTKSYSCAMIIFEISGDISYALPTILAVGIAVFVTRMFSISIYDKISITRGLPWLPELPQSMYGMSVCDIMNTDVQFLTYDATPQKIAKLLASPQKHKAYPIVNSSESMMVVGMVYRKDLLKFLLHSSTVLDWHTPVTMESSLSDRRDVIPGLKTEAPGARRVLYIKPAPVQLLSSTPLAHCQMLFITLRLSDAFVTSNSRLVGIVTRNDLRLAIGQNTFRPIVVFVQKVWAGIWAVIHCFKPS